MADGETIIVTCSCGQRMKAPVQAIGKAAACVKCGEKVLIQRPEDAAESAPAQESEQAAGPPRKKPSPAFREGASVLELLRENNLVDDEGLKEAELIRKDMGWADWEALVEIGRVKQEDFMKIMAGANAARIDLKNYTIPTEVTDLVPEELVKKGRLFPVDKLGKMLTIAMACPLDQASIDAVAQATGFKVKVMLASLDDLRNVIGYYYPAIRGQAAYDDAFTKELDNEFKEIAGNNTVCARVFDADPPLPNKASVDKIQSMSSDGLENLRNALADDPVTALLVLSIANSAAYGFPRRVDNLAMAAAVMGSQALVSAVRSVPAEDYFSLNGSFDFKGFWNRAAVCARAAEAVAETQQTQRSLTAYTAGLVHGIGRLALNEVLPNSYAKLTEGLTGKALLEKEQRLFRVTHPEIGYMVARKLNMPVGITEPVRHHRQFENASKSTEVTAAVGLAAIMADAVEAGAPPKFDQESDLLDKLNLTPAKANDIFKIIAGA